jgi:hypothetical protein
VKGDDGGCFAAALESVRTWGGVLEHPAYSDAWAAHGLNAPPTGGGWVNADMLGGWTCYVEQHRYGHAAKKATWLYAHGVELPSLRWGCIADGASTAPVSWCGNHVKSGEVRPRLGKRAAAASPPMPAPMTAILWVPMRVVSFVVSILPERALRARLRVDTQNKSVNYA